LPATFLFQPDDLAPELFEQVNELSGKDTLIINCREAVKFLKKARIPIAREMKKWDTSHQKQDIEMAHQYMGMALARLKDIIADG